MTLLSNKTIVITGAGRGIGRAAALACAAAGARVVVNDLGCARDGTGSDPAVAAAVVDEILAAGGTAVASPLDVAHPDTPQALLQQATERFGRLDGLLCAAGIERDGSFMRGEAGEDRQLVELGLLATLRLTRAAARRMIAQRKGGALLLCTSATALFGARHQATSGAVGAALVGFAHGLAIELKRHAVRVNALAPVARTRLTEALPTFANIRPTSMTPAQVAPVITYLLSDHAREVTGEVVGAAGGRIYGQRVRETPGVFLEDSELTPERIAETWDDAMRP